MAVLRKRKKKIEEKKMWHQIEGVTCFIVPHYGSKVSHALLENQKFALCVANKSQAC